LFKKHKSFVEKSWIYRGLAQKKFQKVEVLPLKIGVAKKQRFNQENIKAFA
jgi:hypothetical protein